MNHQSLHKCQLVSTGRNLRSKFKNQPDNGSQVSMYLFSKGETRNHLGDFPTGSGVKNLPVNPGDTGSIPGPQKSHVPQSN